MKVDKCEKHMCNLRDKKFVHLRTLQKALDDGLILQKVHRVVKFNQKASLKEYTNMNIKNPKNNQKMMNIS